MRLNAGRRNRRVDTGDKWYDEGFEKGKVVGKRSFPLGCIPWNLSNPCCHPEMVEIEGVILRLSCIGENLYCTLQVLLYHG